MSFQRIQISDLRVTDLEGPEVRYFLDINLKPAVSNLLFLTTEILLIFGKQKCFSRYTYR